MHPGDALVHALPVLLELAQDLRDGCHRNASSLDAAPRGALERSHAAALELQQVERGELDGEQREAHSISVVQPAAYAHDVVEVPQLPVRAAHAARDRQGLLAVDDRGIEPLEPDPPAERLLR